MTVDRAPASGHVLLPNHLPGGAALGLHYRDWGGHGAPLLLLHGLASNARIWDLTAPHLASHFSVIALDQRGHGLSDKPESFSFDEVTDDLLAVIHALKLDRPVLVGHSWGASVALHFAAHHPHLVRALALVDGGVIDISALSSWEQAEKQMMPPTIDGVPLDAFVNFASKWPHFRDIWSPLIEEMVLSNLLVEDGKVYRRLSIEKHMLIARAIYDLNPASLYPRIASPVLLVPALQEPASEQERTWHTYRQQGVEAALRMLVNARLTPIANSPHDIPVFRPKELAQAIIEFAGVL